MKTNGVTQKKMYRKSQKGTGAVVFCGSQGCCPEGKFTPDGGLVISDNGVEISFSADQVTGLCQALNDKICK